MQTDLDIKVGRIASAVLPLASKGARILIAVAGPPASGKSTLAAHLQQRLQHSGTPCGLVPMDGFHLDNETLDAGGLLARKGAPNTFDLRGFASLLERLGEGGDVSVPLFDRHNDCILPNAATVTAQQRHVIVEGNYLFLRGTGWRDLARFWSFGVFIAPPLPVLEARLIQRWLDHGLDHAAAKHRAHQNDLTNAKLVLAHCNKAAIDMCFDGSE